ncbi:hypothetical protein PINS_up004828 [Pythium insidiosum]|nr:hypothetical protein PINS_up004828 [Pythium insidiosum]
MAVGIGAMFMVFLATDGPIIIMTTTETTTTALQAQELFERAFPDVLSGVLPLRWLWRFATRRFGWWAADWNAGHEPIATLLADGIMYGEGPRFRLDEQALYLTDMYAKRVLKFDLQTKRLSTAYQADEYVSGLGWLPDGRLLIVAMESRRLLVLDQQQPQQAEEYADISAVTRFRANDMVVDARGRAYVGNYGFDFKTDFTAATTTMKTTLVRVDTDRSVHIEATRMFFPNGSVITPDGKTLIVAETFAGHLTAFDIRDDGSLSNRRVWADVGAPCDGIALDADGCMWVAVPQIGLYPTGGALIRVREGGEILNLYGLGQNGISRSVFACQLGTDADGKHHVFFLEATTSEEHRVLAGGEERARRNCVLKSIEVAVGPARVPGDTRYCGGYC